MSAARIARHTGAAALVLVLAACAMRQPAPVVDRRTVTPAREEPVEKPVEIAPAPKPIPTHVVKRGETLVAIALNYGLEYRELAAWNNITNVNVIGVGQVLMLAPPGGTGSTPLAGAAPLAGTAPLASAGPPIEARPLANTPQMKVEPRGQKVPFSERALAQLSTPEGAGSPPAPVPGPVASAPPAAPPPAPQPPAPEPARGTDREDVDWMWPVKGKVLAPFTDSVKGMEIAGKKGAPVLAAASGRVIYVGTGVRGLGKLVIVKHNALWLSAYGHNDAIVVKEQQDVKKGQKIAEMGSTDTDQVKLHFQIRRQDRPIDPAKLLPPG